jgi:hypothetical protein
MTITVDNCTPEELKQIRNYFATVFPDADVKSLQLELNDERSVFKTSGEAFVTKEGHSIRVGDEIVCFPNRNYAYKVTAFDSYYVVVLPVGQFEDEWVSGDAYPELDRSLPYTDSKHPLEDSPRDFYPYFPQATAPAKPH